MFNYQDDKADEKSYVSNFQTDLLGNVVPDCVSWNMLEGFKIFFYQQKFTREFGNRLVTRSNLFQKPRFSFGHELGPIPGTFQTIFV